MLRNIISGCIACFLFLASTASAENAEVDFQIESQPLDAALLQFGQQANIPLLFSHSEVEGLTSVQVLGRFTPAQAITLLLKGTGMRGAIEKGQVLTIKTGAKTWEGNNTMPEAKNIPDTDKNRRVNLLAGTFAATSAILVGAPIANAQQNNVESAPVVDVVQEDSEVVLDTVMVSVRKRDETLQEVPIQVAILTGDQLDQFGTTEFTDLQNRVAGLNLSIGGSAGGGGAIGLRGISTSSNQAGFEQSVSVVVDGVQVSRPGVMSAALFDVSQVDVIKGPQALFYGKNTPAGAIEIRTRNPGDEHEGFLTSSYEFEADEIKLVGAYGGPINDKFGFRIAGLYRDMDGWFRNAYTTPLTDDTISDFATSGIPQPGDPRPGSSEWALRATIAGDFTDRWSTNLKVSYADYEDGGPLRESEITRCGSTTVHSVNRTGLNPFDSCEITGVNSRSNLTPQVQFEFPNAQSEHYSETEQLFVSFTNDFELTENLTLTSLTGIFELDTALQDNFDYSPFNNFPSTEAQDYSSFTQEVRLASDYSGPFNFLIGGFYEDSSLDYLPAARIGAFGADPTTGRFFTYIRPSTTDTESLSAFGQIIFDITDTVELSGGARYTNEKRDSTMQHSYTHAFFLTPIPQLSGLPVGIVLEDNQEVDDLSPEVTLTWRPNDDLSIYGSYKEGYKSGGMALSSILSGYQPVDGGGNPLTGQALTDYNTTYRDNFTFEPEFIEGFEVGIKTQWFNDTMTFNISAFDYDYSNLQVSQFDSNSNSFRINNAAAASVTGIELENNWRINDNLTVWGGLNWLDASYDDYVAECYDLQTAAEGCVTLASGAQVFQRQGQALTRAPEWSAVFGFDATQYLSNDIVLNYTVSGVYTDEHETAAIGNPLTFQDAFTKFDAGARATWKDKYTLALYGRNLTDELVTSRLSDAPGSANSTDAARILRGRQVVLELGVEF